MHRSLAMCLALILSTLSIATTGFAAEIGVIRFDLEDNGRDRMQLTAHTRSDRNRSSSTSVKASDLAGFDRAALAGRNGTPVRFALVREPGRLDCAGSGQDKRAKGTCRFTGDPAYAAFLVANGVRRPTEQELLTLTMVGAGRPLVEALRKGRYEMPSPSTLAGMTALNISPEYIREMAAHGYRPRRPEDFLPLKALNISPAYIRSLKSVGYDRVPVEELIQLKALGITADFIASYQRHGFKNLSVSRLVQLKALGLRPEDIGRPADRVSLLEIETGTPLMMSAFLP